MDRSLAYVEHERVYLFGDEFALNSNREFEKEGWYIVVERQRFVDKSGNERPIVFVIGKVSEDDMEFKEDVLNIHALTSKGINLICNKYKKWLGSEVLRDSRYRVLEDIAVNYNVGVELYRDSGSLIMLNKLKERVLDKMFDEYFAKSE